MTRVLEGHRPELVELCRKYRVRRLDVFGSAARGDFNEHSSDVDLLVEFDDMPHADRADAYLGFLMAVEALLRRRVDLVELGAVRKRGAQRVAPSGAGWASARRRPTPGVRRWR